MNLDQATEQIQRRFITLWGTTTLYTFKNEKFAEAGADSSWVRLSVRELGGGQFTLGPVGERKYQRIGLIIAQVFTPLIRGTRTGSSLGTDLRAIFEGTRFSDVYCWDGRVLDIGPDGKHHQTNVEIDITYEEIK